MLARARLRLHWGFWTRLPLVTARQDTLLIPPPSTLLGAFASGLASVLRDICDNPYGELKVAMEESMSIIEIPLLRELVKSRVVREVFFKVIEGFGVKNVDLSRVFQAPYVNLENIEDNWRRWSYAVRTTGKVYAPLMNCEIAYLVEKRALLNLAEKLCPRVDSTRLVLASILSLSRLGSVEGIITVERVEVTQDVECEELKESPSSPCPYFAITNDMVREVAETRSVAIVNFWDWRGEGFWYSPRRNVNTIPYVVPVDTWYLESGIIPPFKSCNLIDGVLRRIGRGIYVVNGDEKSFYPVPHC
jgi:CRISPR-associated protein Cas5 subtype I-A